MRVKWTSFVTNLRGAANKTLPVWWVFDLGNIAVLPEKDFYSTYTPQKKTAVASSSEKIGLLQRAPNRNVVVTHGCKYTAARRQLREFFEDRHTLAQKLSAFGTRFPRCCWRLVMVRSNMIRKMITQFQHCHWRDSCCSALLAPRHLHWFMK